MATRQLTGPEVYPNAVTPAGETARSMRESPYAIRPSDRKRSGPRGTGGAPAGTWGVVHPTVTTPGTSGIGAPGQGHRGAYNTTPVPTPTGPQANSPYGSESGPGILESWFNQRVSGTDPAFEYAARRGMEDLGNRYGAAGLGNSGAARQGESDFYANLVAQRMGQLDALAGGAAGEHQNRVNAMFQQGMGIAGGQAGLSSAYDLGAAGNMDAANRAQTQMFLNKAGVDAQGNQAGINNVMRIWGMGVGSGGGGGGRNPYGG